MIFIPSHGGKSHCPEEQSSLDDMARGVLVLAHTLVDLAG
jgi:N-carbamoyl-L-amino-acid hydrolase